MGLRVNTNVASIGAQRNLSQVTDRLQGNYARLASGLRIATAADDAAGLGISESLRSSIRSFGAAGRNAQDGLSLSQTAEGSLGEVSNILSRLRELAVQSSNGTLNTEDRETLEVEFTALTSEIDRISNDAEFNGINLLDGSETSVNIQVGLDSGQGIAVTLVNSSTSELGIDSSGVDTVDNALSALEEIDDAIVSINQSRGQLGADQNRLTSAFRSIQSSRENLSAAESRIRDVDVAVETADLTRNSILQQAATSILSQANAQPQLALSLLG